MQHLIDRFAQLRVLVVGDVSLDEYLFGRATRLSREAPIPVLEFQRREHILGGAANPARNLVALGAAAAQIGVVGDDDAGIRVAALLAEANIAHTGLLAIPGRVTTLKTRILAHDGQRAPQQLARLDRLDRSPLPPAQEQRLIDALHRVAPGAHALICSDYQLGLLTPTLVAAVRDLCRRNGLLLTVDAQGSAGLYTGVDLFRCNDAEAAATLGRTLEREEDFRTALPELQRKLNAKAVIVTRGPAGLSLIDAQGNYEALPAANRSEVYDTTGAGDTFIAVATLALAAGGTLREAAALANTAAGLVVRRLGNAVVSPGELGGA